MSITTTVKVSLKHQCIFQFCLGVTGGMPATVENVEYLSRHIPEGSTWSAFGIGAGHMPVLYTAIALGGHVRVGLEDNVVYGYDKEGKKILANNLMLVERAARAVEAYGNELLHLQKHVKCLVLHHWIMKLLI